MSIKLAMEIQRAHERIDALEKQPIGVDFGITAAETEFRSRIEKLEGELKALKARMGKTREVAEI